METGSGTLIEIKCPSFDTCKKQADEIERLREALKHISEIGDYPTQLTIARSALQQNEAQILATNTYEAEGRN